MIVVVVEIVVVVLADVTLVFVMTTLVVGPVLRLVLVRMPVLVPVLVGHVTVIDLEVVTGFVKAKHH